MQSELLCLLAGKVVDECWGEGEVKMGFKAQQLSHVITAGNGGILLCTTQANLRYLVPLIGTRDYN